MKIISTIAFYPILFRFAVITFLLMGIASCHLFDDNDEPFNNYLYRLSNSLDVPSSLTNKVLNNTVLGNKKNSKENGETSLIRYPSLRDLTHNIPPNSINIMDFLSLSRCDLQRHIGQRNSSLGRFMKPSQKLIYEYEFIRLAELCLPSLETNSELALLLSEVLMFKKEQLSLVKWNALFASEEMATLFSLGTQALDLEGLTIKPSALYEAFNVIVLFLDNKIDSPASIEEAYAIIASSKRVGELRLSMQMIIQYLAQADTLLEYRISNKPLCFDERPNSKFDIVNTVFMKFYIGEIQPYISLVSQQEKILFDKVELLASSLEPTPAFQVFWDQVYRAGNSERNQFNEAIKKHTEHWQALLSQCGRLPR